MSESRPRSNRNPAAPRAVRHGRLKRSAAWRTVVGFLGAAMAVVLVATGSVAAIAVWQLRNNIDTVAIGADDKAPPPNIAAYEGGFNILIVGSDTREGQGGLGGADEGSVLNDVNMLLHVAQDQRSAVLVSIPRDMVVPIPDCENGGPAAGRPINETLYYGGLNCVVMTVQNLTGLDIQFAGLIDFRGVVNMANAVGGVEVCTDAPIVDRYSGLNIPEAGRHVLSGEQALAFLRTRHGVGDGSDLGRISAQQVYLSSLVRKIKSEDTLTDFSKLYGLAQAATQSMTLSENFSRVDTLVQIALALKDIPLQNIAMVQYPGTTGGTGMYAGKVQPITAQANALFQAIKDDVPIALDQGALGGSHAGSQLDPEAPIPTPDGSATPAPTESAGPTEEPTTGPVVVPGVKGQTADQYTCAVAN